MLQVLVANDEAQPVATLFPRTMAALEACGAPTGVRLIAFGKQLPHSALHWHSDGRNFMLTAHLTLAGPSQCSGERTPPFGPPRGAPFPGVERREGAAGMVLAPLMAPPAIATPKRSPLTRLLGAAMGKGEPPRTPDANAVSCSWTPAGQGGEATSRVFDTTFMHSAYNDGDEAADILFVDFFHPDLSPDEQTAIKCLQKLLRERGEAAYGGTQR